MTRITFAPSADLKMNPMIPTPDPLTSSVSFSVDDALKLANVIGALVSALVPGSAAAVAAATGGIGAIRTILVPAIERMKNNALNIAEQAALDAESAAERIRVGAPPATTN